MAALDSHRTKAYNRSVDVATTAMTASTRLERFVGKEQLERAIDRREELPWRVRRRAWWRARREDRKFDAGRALQLYELLQTTFEPGLLLLVASNGPNRDDPDDPPPMKPPNSTDDPRAERLEHMLAERRKEVAEQLANRKTLRPRPLIEYVQLVPLKSPRVVYNLACYYSVAAKNWPDHKDEYLELASEYLRQSIVRTPPSERRGLLGHALDDRDLQALRESEFSEKMTELWKFVPGDQPNGAPL